jgi:PAS domain S-box-containing protein
MDPQQHRPDPADIRDFPRRQGDGRARRTYIDDGLRQENDELVTARTSLEREKRKYYELFELAPDAYLVTDIRGVVREANAAATRLLGVSCEFLMGKPLLAFFDESARRSYPQQLDRLCGSDRVDDWEVTVRSRAGDSIPVAVSIGQMMDTDRKLAGYRWIVRDITSRKLAESAVRDLNRELELRVASRTTQLAVANKVKDELLVSERKAREEAETANRVKSEFLALLSHEFRTPLQAVFGYTELLECEVHGSLNEAQHRYVQRIQQSQQHLLGVINTILDFAKLESGQPVDVDLRPTRIDELLRLLECFVAPQLETKRISYECWTGDTALYANADPIKVRQIILNLVSNAIKFTDQGGAVVAECEGDANGIAVHVRDTGVGIPADKLDAIFEPFIQIPARRGVTTGTGLGLSISRRLAQAMGGSLTASSEPGNGSTFTLRLARAEPTESGLS